MGKKSRVDAALERQAAARQEAQDRESRAYVQRHGLTAVSKKMTDDAIARYDKAWTRKDGAA